MKIHFCSTFEWNLKFWILFKCIIILRYLILFIFIFNFFVGCVNTEILFFIFLDEDIVVGNVELMDLEDNVLPVQIMIKIWWWYRLFYLSVFFILHGSCDTEYWSFIYWILVKSFYSHLIVSAKYLLIFVDN